MVSLYKDALKDALYPKVRGTLTKRNKYLVATAIKTMDKDEIRALRRSLQLSVRVFADVLGVSAKTVEAWEKGTNVPSGPALRLMNAMKRHPDILIESGMFEERFR